ncbi:MAG: hypothetical protein ACREXJ_02465 [Gammaproteobacteria bacterium]
MTPGFGKSQIAVAVAAAVGATTLGTAPGTASAGKPKGTYVTGDFHNHTTCSDGSTSMQKLVKKSTDKVDTPWGLDWFVQAGHGGSGNRNCTLLEDESLSTPAYPFVEGQGPATTWAASIGAANVKGNTGSPDASSTTPLSSQANPSMWRWQSIQEFQYPVMEYLSALKNLPLFIGLESVVAGHEHTSMSVITGQMPAGIGENLPNTPGYIAMGDATALSQWSYCFDRNDTDNSRGGGQEGWNCTVTGSLNETDPSWKPVAAKLVPAVGAGVGDRGHLKTVEAMKWMAEYHPKGSYYVPAHLERAGPFNPDGNNGFNVEDLRDFNNAAPTVAFGMETQPGHHASDQRGEYTIRRNNIGGVNIDSVGGTTYGGTGVYGAQIGGVWDALLGEGRNFWFFASSDWHNRGSFGPDDRRSTQDFYPGEYQRDYVMVRSKSKQDRPLTPQAIVNGLRSGNSWTASGQLIDRLAFVACADTPIHDAVAAALAAAAKNTDIDLKKCATMGEKLVVDSGAEIVVAIVVRDPSGTNYAPYTFPNPSLAQIDIQQPLNAPVLDHIDVIGGLVTAYKDPDMPDYYGQWPSDWINNPNLANVPAGAKNTSAAILRAFNSATWKTVPGAKQFKKMTFRIRAVTASQYLRLRGTNLPPSVPNETDANGNPLPDLSTNPAAVNPSSPGGTDGIPANTHLRIPCMVTGTNVPGNDITYTGAAIDGCPAHLPSVDGQKFLAFDVAAWADLWFYSNPIFIEVKGSAVVAGVE